MTKVITCQQYRLIKSPNAIGQMNDVTVPSNLSPKGYAEYIRLKRMLCLINDDLFSMS